MAGREVVSRRPLLTYVDMPAQDDAESGSCGADESIGWERVLKRHMRDCAGTERGAGMEIKADLRMSRKLINFACWNAADQSRPLSVSRNKPDSFVVAVT